MRPEDLFAGFSSPLPPTSLRDRVLSEARTTRPVPEAPLLDRLWSSRALRMGWAALVLALLFANAALHELPSPVGSHAVNPAPSSSAFNLPDEGLKEMQALAFPPRVARGRPRMIDVWLDPGLPTWTGESR